MIHSEPAIAQGIITSWDLISSIRLIIFITIGFSTALCNTRNKNSLPLQKHTQHKWQQELLKYLLSRTCLVLCVYVSFQTSRCLTSGPKTLTRLPSSLLCLHSLRWKIVQMCSWGLEGMNTHYRWDLINGLWEPLKSSEETVEKL